MVKRLALILAALSWISPFSVFALGLGSIDMQSTLNQRLDARIELLRVRPGELKALEVALASADTFRRAGIDRPAFLARISFDLVQPRSGGKPYIQLSSSQPITEPFLNFLIEVNWANGRLLREFTVLVDPPVLSAESKQRSVQTPATARTAPRSAPSRRQESVTRGVPASTRPAPRVSTTEAGGVNYGPTRRGDTLWEIAAQMRSDSSVSVPQMMMALLENNPQAFYNGNINNLKMGHVLRLSDSGDATSISANDAARMAGLQYEEWKDNRGMVGSSPSRTRPVATRRGPDGARVKLVSPGEGEDGTGTPRSVAEGSDAARLSEELSLAQEALDATRQETNELNSQMTALNDQIETMKRLVMLKDNQLVALQSQLKESGQTPEMPEATEEASLEMASAMETEEPVTEQAEQLAVDAVATDDALEGSAADQAEMEAILSGEGGESQVVDPQELAVEESTAQAPVDMAADKETGIMATLMALPARFMSDFKVMGIGIALILIIGGFVWMFIRRRKLQEFQESILTGQSSLGEGEAAADAPSEDASFMSDFAVSSMEGIQTEISDVDPISEADVYLAYGRYKQAEELINSAIETDPERAELKLKSLEIHFSAKDKDAFELQAEMYKDSLGDTEHWAKVTEMGQELCPENEMFSGSAVTSSEDTASGEAGEMDFSDSEFTDSEFADLSTDDSVTVGEASAGEASETIDFGDSEFADLGTDDSTTVEDKDTNSLDFDLGTSDETPAVEEAVAETAAEEDNSLDFDMGDFSTDSETSSVDESEDISVSADTEDNSLDFDLGSFETEESTDSELTADAGEDELVTAEDDDNSLDFDLSVDDTPAAGLETEDAASGVEITNEDMESELDESLFADVDEVGTKLDLAKAYIDMGDSDGAKSILDEVLQEGDDTQKNEAEGLMAQMA